MGFFSWKTADTHKSISNKHTNRCKPVYLLQPSGPHIKEPAYEGYGVFNGVDAYVWLAEHNLPHHVLADMDEESRRSAGIMLTSSVFKDTTTGRLYTVFHSAEFLKKMGVQVTHLGVTWDVGVPAFDGLTANEAIEKGRIVPVPIDELIPVQFPLKFSFDENARYENLGPSAECPDQGYFYDDESPEEDPKAQSSTSKPPRS